ncbi:thioredoxin family protein [Streptacidiphilus cavernicola]|uniref:Thioredoxin family protein n=1 Tax=Streptacidiphilus cavernicola TaxID=3342716 RepID=A0ABV6VVH8_9ACTN
MKLTILAVPDCPNAPLLRQRITHALAGQPATEITWHEVTNQEQAERLGMHGSPTLLIDGVDPFAAPGQPTSLSCRLYRDQRTASGAPSTDQLRGVLQAQRE